MIAIHQLKMPLEYEEKELLSACSRRLHISEKHITDIQIIKKSLDARKKPHLFWVLHLAVTLSHQEESVLHRCKNDPDIFRYEQKRWRPVCSGGKKLSCPPVVVGSGPAGLFCAYLLAGQGYAPLILERGKSVRQRQKDVETFWETGILNEASNVQFGEGGAGTFSDGKLNTLIKDKAGRNRFVLETFVRFGAPEEILYEQKPHIGTDILISILEHMREEIQKLGGTFRFESRVSGIEISGDRLTTLIVEGQSLPVQAAVFAIGHSARDTIESLYRRGVMMTGKEFAMGFRMEHPQAWLNLHQYGMISHPRLHPASYKLATRLPGGRGVYSFCMCPGGYVVNASSEEGRLAVNGMSYSGRDSHNANSAIVVTVGEEEFDVANPMAAIAYQRRIEEAAYKIAGGKIPQQLWKDFLAQKPSVGYESFASVTKGRAAFGELHKIFSPAINEALIAGMHVFESKIRGFASDDTILSGVESRTSSPVRIPRNEAFESNIAGLYPCGEGAGYAGGIMSAAMDGMKVAEQIIASYEPPKGG